MHNAPLHMPTESRLHSEWAEKNVRNFEICKYFGNVSVELLYDET